MPHPPKCTKWMKVAGKYSVCCYWILHCNKCSVFFCNINYLQICKHTYNCYRIKVGLYYCILFLGHVSVIFWCDMFHVLLTRESILSNQKNLTHSNGSILSHSCYFTVLRFTSHTSRCNKMWPSPYAATRNQKVQNKSVDIQEAI
jgi:hypothetical protein